MTFSVFFDAFANPLRSMVAVVRVKLLCSTVLSDLKRTERDQYGWQNVAVNPRFKYVLANDLIWEGMEQLMLLTGLTLGPANSLPP